MIRKCNRKDLEGVYCLFAELWPDKKLDKKKVKGILDKYLTDENYGIYCFEEDKLEGIITYSIRWAFYYEGKVAIIEDLIVKKEKRRKKIGEQLVKYLEKELKRKEIYSIELATDKYREDAKKFWKKMNYKNLAEQFRK